MQHAEHTMDGSGWAGAARATLHCLTGCAIGEVLGMVLATALDLAISVMELMDNLVLLAVPGALAAGLADGLFWASLVASLVVAFVVTVPVNRALIARGKGHAVVHAFHRRMRPRDACARLPSVDAPREVDSAREPLPARRAGRAAVRAERGPRADPV